MTTTKASLVPIMITPGVQPSTDKTALATPHFTMADKIRFRFGFPQKIGGWVATILSNGAAILGMARSLYGAVTSSQITTVIGTSSKLYSLFGSVLTNITPLLTATTAISNSLATDYGTLGGNPITTTNGSSIITVVDPHYSDYQIGDVITLSGATAVGGIGTSFLNTKHVIHGFTSNGYTTITGGTATSGATGGGGSVVRSTGRIIVSATAHGQVNGQRVQIAGATNTGGIVAATFINAQFIIRNVATNTFDIMTGGTATSSVTGGGGTGTTYQVEIAAGAINESLGQGYGMGLFGVGFYGTALLSPSDIILPRIWYIDRYGSDIIMTPGSQNGVYAWAGSDAVAPALVTNAPTAVNYAFVSNNILVTFGAGGTPNRIFSSDQGNFTQWTSSSSNQVFDYTVNGAATLKSHVSVAGVNLIWSDFQTYLFSYLGYTAGVANAIWNVQLLEGNVGLIGPMARVAIAGVAYWMGQNNFYMWPGGNVTIIPASTQDQSTILNYVFQNINRGQTAKCFAYYNELFDEIEFHYPSAGSNECDKIARLNRTDLTWVPDTADRTCAEYPNQVLSYPRLIDSNGVLYQHENGTDDNGSPLPFSLTTNLQGRVTVKNAQRILTDDNSIVTAIVPDSVQTGNINVQIIGKRYPQSANDMYNQTLTVTPTTEFVSPSRAGARLWQLVISGSELGQSWIAGMWHTYQQEGSKQ